MERVFRWASARSRTRRQVLIAAKLLLALVAIGIVGKMVDWRMVADNFDNLFFPVLAGIGVMTPALAAMALRWKMIIGTETLRRFSFVTALRGWCLALFFNLLVPGFVGGDLARIHYASRHAEINYSRALSVVLAERLFGLLSICILAGFGVALNAHLDRFIAIPAAQLMLALAVGAAVTLAAVGLIRRYTHTPLRLFPGLLILSVAGQASDFLLIHFYGRVVSVDIPLETLLLIVPLMFLAAVIPLTPGGQGVRELTLTALLTVAGVPVREAALIALMLFVTRLLFSLVCALALVDGSQFYKVRQMIARKV